MANITRPLVSLTLLLCLCAAVSAQTPAGPAPPPAPVTVAVSLTGAGLRFTALGPVRQTRLEVFDASGAPVFDSGFLPGGIRVWSPQQVGQTMPADGTYQCVVTARDLAGRLSLKQGAVEVAGGQVALRLGEAEGAGEVERQQDALSPVGGERPALTITAHDGRDGQVVSTAGDLTLRTGDFFSGKDEERVRVTEDGRVGIGTDKPEATLDVAGEVRAREGFRFSDGSTLKAENGKLSVTNSAGDTMPGLDAAGTGTINRLAKWSETGGAGTLTDSLLEESGQNIVHRGRSLQMTGAASPAIDTNLLYLDASNKTTGVLAGSVPSFVAANGPYFAMRGNTYTALANQRGIFGISAGQVSTPGPLEGSIRFLTANDQLRLFVKHDGNVGIGTNDPTSKLHVAGNVNFTGLRTETNAFSPNVIGGASANSVTTGVVGATIGGGGSAGGANGFYPNRVTGVYGTVGGGIGNSAASSSTVGGGYRNTASGGASTVPGGSDNVAAGDYSFAAGLRAKAAHRGSFVWSDTTTLNPNFFTSTADNQFLINATGGVGIGTNAPEERLHVSGGAILLDNNQGLFVKDTGGNKKRVLIGDSSNILRLGSRSPTGFDEIRFDVNTSGVEAMTIKGSGNVGIGDNNPQAKLDIVGGADADGTNDPKAISLAHRAFGYRHWIRTRHNVGAVAGNAIDFFVNAHSSDNGSTAPGVGNVHVMSLDNGKVGVGTTTPEARLDINGASSAEGTPIAIIESTGSQIPLSFKSSGTEVARIRADNSGNLIFATVGGPTKDIHFRAGVDDSDTEIFIQSSTSRVGIGTTTPGAKLDVNGSVKIANPAVGAGNLLCRDPISGLIVDCSASSARYKENVLAFDAGLSVVLGLRPVSFTWKGGGPKDMGLVAEEVHGVEPLLNTYDAGGGVSGVRYDRLPVVLVNAVQEQQAQITAQQQTIAELRRRNSALEARLGVQNARLEARLGALERATSKNVRRPRHPRH